MKKITLLLFILVGAVLNAQQQQYLLDFESGTPSTVVGNWATFENPSPGLDVVINPTPNGVNTSATTQVLKLNLAEASACYAGAINFHNTLGTWQFDGAVTSNLTLSMDVYRSTTNGNIGIKFANATDGTVLQITDNQGAVSAANTWETLTWDISAAAASGDNVNVDQIVIFIDWRCDGEPARPGDIELLVDNITWGANKLTDPPVPTCSDGIQNQDETGIDCGGSVCDACITEPVASAESPAIDESNVLSVFSDTYMTNTIANFNFNAFAGGGAYTTVDIESNGNLSGKMENLSFYGAQWDAVDINAYTYVHLDYYATTSTAFNFYLIDMTAGIPGGNPAEPRYAFATTGGDETFVPGQWNSIFIPLQHFLDYPSTGFTYDLDDIFQWKFDGNGTVYFDNVYFSKTNTLSLDAFDKSIFRVSPNPTQNIWKVKSAEQSITSITLYDVLGKNVLSMAANAKEVNIDATNLKSGLYFAQIKTNLGIKSIKLIKN
ncbi:T9SS type A sorting domain-containing protein [uncultured Algibacter sp.]|uniref:T9SS type A sorting domain-containing protein n=1 Tax=uncultured Algibacter sp. TaxID=298659 RepID=UPI002606D124|nr:T9SS type A sorting domain-containing protein [uncultured Algibacter sp.]